jgi:hypothetical protein
MTILSKAIYRFNSIPIKIAMSFFKQIGKISPKIHMEAQRLQILKAILSKKSNAGGITIPDLKL